MSHMQETTHTHTIISEYCVFRVRKLILLRARSQESPCFLDFTGRLDFLSCPSLFPLAKKEYIHSNGDLILAMQTRLGLPDMGLSWWKSRHYLFPCPCELPGRLPLQSHRSSALLTECKALKELRAHQRACLIVCQCELANFMSTLTSQLSWNLFPFCPPQDKVWPGSISASSH